MNAPDDSAIGTRRRSLASAIGERVRKLRGLAKLSARATDRLAGLSESHTSLLERTLGERIAARTAIAIAGTFGVSLDWLLTGAGSEPSSEGVREAVARARERAALRLRDGIDGEPFAGDSEERRGSPKEREEPVRAGSGASDTGSREHRETSETMARQPKA